MLQDYSLSLDGPLLRQQRELLITLTDDARNGRQVQLRAEEVKLLEGLVELTDAIADQAHDHGIDCLIEERSKTEGGYLVGIDGSYLEQDVGPVLRPLQLRCGVGDSRRSPAFSIARYRQYR